MPVRSPIELKIQPGVYTIETDRGGVGFYKDCDRIRFANGLPQKLAGWDVQSVGQEDSVEPDETLVAVSACGTSWAAGAGSIASLSPAMVVTDADPLWLFGDPYGAASTVSDATAVRGSYDAVLAAAFTAPAGAACVIEFGEEYGGGTSISNAGSAGSTTIVLASALNTFRFAGAVIIVNCVGGIVHRTTLRTTVSAGSTSIELTDPLPAAKDTGTPNIFIYAPRTIFTSPVTMGGVPMFLAHAMVASSTALFTEALPANANGKIVNIVEFQETAASGTQASTTISITPVTSFAWSGAPGSSPHGRMVRAVRKDDEIKYVGQARAFHDWVDLDAERWLAIGTNSKLYLVNNDVLYDITPIRISGTLASNPFDTSATGAYDPAGGGDRRYVRVTHVGHALTVGTYVRFDGASAVGGITIDGEYVVADITAADTYVIAHTIPADSTANGGGASVTYEYDINAGPEISQTEFGWGTGIFGAGAYGVGDQVTGVTREAQIWSLDNFGENLLASVVGGPLYIWRQDSGPTTRATVIDNAPDSIQRMMVSTQARHIVALGSGPGSSMNNAGRDALLIRWASSESTTDWVSTETNSAGDLRLDSGSRIITGVKSRGEIIVFTDESLHALQYIGAPLYFTLRHLGRSVRIIGPNAAVDVNGIVYFMGVDDFLMYDGVLKPIECPVQNHVFENFSFAEGAQVFACVNKKNTEVWWLYCSSSATSPDRYVKYNYTEQAWDFGTMQRTAMHDESQMFEYPYAANGGLIYLHDNGVDEGEEHGKTYAQISYLETWDMDVSAGRSMMHVATMIPDFKVLTGDVRFRLSGRGYPQRTRIDDNSTFLITSATEKVSTRFRTRQIAFRITSQTVGDDWRMGTWLAEAVPHGRRGQ